MLSILRDISISCFFGSYLVVLCLELLRLVGRVPGRGLMVIVMTVVGLFTHVCYLVLRVGGEEGSAGALSQPGLLATWSDWSLLLALGLAVSFFFFYLRRPDTIIGFFFLPAVMVMIAVAWLVRNQAPFSRTEAFEVWRTVHGFSMMAGSVCVLVGFLAGVMYLVQSRRLKNHLAGSRLRLPTLETLSGLNRRCLLLSTSLVSIGVVAGIVMNLNRWGKVGWTDGGILLSSLLLLWLIVTTIVEYRYEPSSRGRKAVYLTLASLGFLILAFVGVVRTDHGQSKIETTIHSQIW